jgi:1,4-dihydroxy-2-naphthoate octaprenyltransferase
VRAISRTSTPRGALSVSDVLCIVEARTKIISSSSVLVETAYAAWVTDRVDWVSLLLMLAGTVAIDLGTAGFNSYFDFIRGVDTVETDVEGYKALVHRDVDPRIALWIAGSAFALAGIFGVALGARVGWEVVAVGAGCMVVAFFYSGGPRPIASTPLGELFAGGFLGLVVVALSAYVQAGRTLPLAMVVAVPTTLLIADILTVNNTCDMEGDAAAGRRTLSIVLGASGARVLVVGLVVAALAAALALVALGVLPVASLVPRGAWAAFAVRELRRMHGRGYAHRTKGASMTSISVVLMTYTLALLIGLVLDGLGGHPRP